MKERTKLGLMLAAFVACYFLPVEELGGAGAVHESLALVRWYAREHVLLCLVPAFFIAGAMSVLLSGEAVMRYLGPSANRMVAYPVAATSGTILAVCSCTVLPLFAGIRQRGAGLGPATAFLYSGPAINVLAIILTAQILGPELGLARAFGAVIFAVVIGLLMSAIFRKDDVDVVAPPAGLETAEGGRAGWQDVAFFAAMVGVLVFANWAKPSETTAAVWAGICDSDDRVVTTLAVSEHFDQ